MGENGREKEWGSRFCGWGASGLGSRPAAVCHRNGALSSDIVEGLPVELLCADGLVLIAETGDLLL